MLNKFFSMSSDLFVFNNSFSYENSQEIQENSKILIEGNNNAVDETSYNLDQVASILLSSSPPNSKLENLSLSHLENANYSALEVKTEEIKTVCSTGDLQKDNTIMQTRNKLSSSSSSTENSFTEEANFKVGRYSAEERKERIDRYRAKRTLRNFNKTIKYACRKTLADNRPRIRGRFARNDEVGDILKTSMFQRCEYEDDLWIDGFHEEDDEAGIVRMESFFDSFESTQYQNYSY